MTMREFLESRRKAEYPALVKVIQTMPADRFDYRPHQRSPSAAEVVWTRARETQACGALIDEGRINWTAQASPADPQAIISAFQEHYAALTDRIGRLTDGGWRRKVQLLIDGT